MSIRSGATQWYKNHHRSTPHYFRTSKYYQGFESWSKTPCWWFQFPLQWLDEKLESHIVFVGEKAPNQNEFIILKIPIHYFLEKLKGFTLLAENINLMFSAENYNKFRDVRGKGNVDFAQFLVKR